MTDFPQETAAVGDKAILLIHAETETIPIDCTVTAVGIPTSAGRAETFKLERHDTQREFLACNSKEATGDPNAELLVLVPDKLLPEGVVRFMRANETRKLLAVKHGKGPRFNSTQSIRFVCANCWQEVWRRIESVENTTFSWEDAGFREGKPEYDECYTDTVCGCGSDVIIPEDLEDEIETYS